MKVLVTGTRGIPSIPGGVETHCEQLLPRLAAMGAEITVARRAGYVRDSLDSFGGVRIVDIPSPRRKSLEAVVHTFRAINAAKRLRCDMVHINAVGPGLLVPYAKLLGLKVVFTHHGPDYDREKWGNVAKFMLRLGERLACRHADAVIAISDVIRKIIANKYSRTDNVFLIHNGAPSPQRCDFPEYFASLGIEKGKYVLGMSRFVPEKRLDDLVDAFGMAELPDDLKLVIAGDSDFEDGYSAALKKKASAAGAVLTGYIKGRELGSILSGAALYVLPSSHEGLPIALLEAMSYGLDVIASDIPANLELGLPEDDYFRCSDVRMLSEKIRRHMLSASGRIQYDMSAYDWDIIAGSTMDVYKTVYER